MKFGPIALAIAIVAGFTGGAFVQLVADAVGDCHRDPIAFPEACDEVHAHPTLAAWLGR